MDCTVTFSDDWVIDDEAETDVGAVEPPEKAVRGDGEYVGLSVEAPPTSDIVSVRDALRLRPQDDVEPDASENAIREGALYCALGSWSAPPFIDP
jgi:hypothetical protein